jgi:putative redox protein
MQEMSATSTGTWEGGMVFRMEQDGHTFRLDSSAEWGGTDSGPRPKALLLSGLIGCTVMDVVSILRKMKIEGYGLRITAEGEYTEDYPVVFRTIHLVYSFTGTGLPHERVEHAVELSQEKYCGVTAILARTSEIKWEIVYEDEG